MRTAAILPVKRFPLAKQRLGESVADALRAKLARAMVGDVLSALRECPAIEATIVVTCESSVASAARYIGAIVVEDSAEDGQSAAVSLGLQRALQQGFERALCIPAPAAEREVTIVPDRHGSGTNGLLLVPPDALSPSFGPDSRARHERLASDAGAAWRIEQPASLLLDIDTGEDLAVLRERLAGEPLGAPRTRAVLARSGTSVETAGGSDTPTGQGSQAA